MAVIHNTTLTPGKLELLTAWLPGQPWYRGTAAPVLGRAGGFRLDDPDGEVGIEFMVIADTGSDAERYYHAPLTYRAEPLPGATLIGTAEHGVLGPRYIYDGATDPVLTRQLVALLLRRVEAQAQRASDTPDRSVAASYPGGDLGAADRLRVASSADGTDIALADGRVLRIVRELTAEPAAANSGPGQVVAGWAAPGGREFRGTFATVRP